MVKHPAKFTKSLIPVIAKYAPSEGVIIDPFAGVGGIHALSEYVPNTKIIGIELEPEWASQHPNTICANAFDLSKMFRPSSIDAVITSPAYGNRMADRFNATNPKRRNTYTHVLGRKLHEDNTGQMQWGVEYRHFHTDIWNQVYRILKPNGRFILNIKDHIRNKKRVSVTNWHMETIMFIGFEIVAHEQVPVRGNRMGQNGDARIDYESVIVFDKKE